jgi:putative endonuclease
MIERLLLAHHGPEQVRSEATNTSKGQKKKQIMWYLYILRCSDDSLYTGTTTDLCRRLKEHNNKKGGSYTRSRRPVRLIYKEYYPTRSKAQKRESQIKKWSRRKKIALISHSKQTLKKLSKSND